MKLIVESLQKGVNMVKIAMPRKTRREKMKKTHHSSSSSRTSTQDKTVIWFKHDFKKSIVIILCILAFEIGIFLVGIERIFKLLQR